MNHWFVKKWFILIVVPKKPIFALKSYPKLEHILKIGISAINQYFLPYTTDWESKLSR